LLILPLRLSKKETFIGIEILESQIMNVVLAQRTPSPQLPSLLDILHGAAAVGASLELVLAVLVRRLSKVSKPQQVRPGVLG